MESNSDQMAQLREADRAAAAPYLDYPPSPVWYPVATGAWFALMLLAVSALDDHRGWAIAAIVTLVAIEFAFIAWVRRSWGTWPRMAGAPAEITGAYRWYVVRLVALVLVVGVAGWLGGHWVAAGVAFVGTTALIWTYDRIYARAASLTRERLA
ncbi:hypothetical protein [Nocardioides sp.]|uniref:hypothetical protein n=1 Tax=Nocardioides sp. TaxID=35761 RepID=UPI003D0F977F